MIKPEKPLGDLENSGEKKGTYHESKIFCLSLLAGVFAILVQWAVANALTVTETESFNFSTAQVTFNVTNDGNGNVSTTPDH
jgi:hypothetical protein